jgi:succinate dehydrogenase/fumarate reductase flavoprotein subunit
MIKKPGVDKRLSSFLGGFKRELHDTTNMDGAEEGAACSSAVNHGNTDDPRRGKWTSPMPKGDTYGAAPGMSVHTAAGVWCGVDDTEGKTSIPGLYVAGDGTNSSYVGGPNYGAQRGSTSSFFSIQGFHAGDAAAKYTDGVQAVELPKDKVDAISEQVLAPLTVETGYDPTWARDVMHGIISPGWITIAKNEQSLTDALNQIRRLRSLVSGKMMAMNTHDLRLIQEVEHQLLAFEIKLIAGLDRKESRGYHYRTDFPLVNDDYLYYSTYTKGANGEPVFGKVDLPDRWKGDMTADYFTRYPNKNYPEENV